MSGTSGWICVSKYILLNFIIILYLEVGKYVARANPANIDRAKSMSDVVASEGLYSSADKVFILNVTTFEKAVLGSNEAWLVEFYNSWCGHCVRYAPIWKEFAADVAGWSTAANIGVVNCVNEDNTPLCREYEIMHYPSVRFFTAHHSKGNFGKEVEKGRDAPAMRQILLNMLEKEQLDGRGAHWPNITPYRSADLHNLWKNVSKSTLLSILIFKDSKGEVGADLVLDFSRVPNIQTRTVSHENEALAKLMQVTILPSVVIVRRGHENGEILYTQDKSRNGFKILIEAFLKTEGIEIPKMEENTNAVIKLLSAANNDELQRRVKQIISIKGDVVFLADLEHGLRYSLRHEVSARKQISGPVLQSLRSYLQIITHHFPLSVSGRKLLHTLCDQVDGLKELSGEEWRQRLAAAEAALESPAWTERDDFLGCRGSQPNFRGYPCSLWITFHVLTVHALESGAASEPRSVLEAILGFVTHFFGCAECSKHFQTMAAETMFSDVTSHQDAALWLWEAHNKVNARLKGDATEDPEFPKIDFPAVDRCPGCRDGREWVKEQVLIYLRSIYSHESLSTLGSIDTERSISDKTHSVSSGTGMSKVDVSLYLLLCVTSAMIISLVCLKFLLPRSYHKRKLCV